VENLELEIKKMADNIQTIKENANASSVEGKAAKVLAEQLQNDLKNLSSKEDLDTFKVEMQKQFDELAVSNKKNVQEVKSFGQVFSDTVAEQYNDLKSTVLKGGRYKMELKAVGNMTIAGSLTGDSVISYGRNAILPSTKVNFRDLMPTSVSQTLVQAFDRESVGEGSISKQTEGNAKTQIDFDFAEVKTVTSYMSGFARFSKQLMKGLPFLQSTLPRLLLREFYNAENAGFFATVSAAATGSTTTAETDDVKQIMDYIASQRTAKFAASYGVVSHTQLARLNKLTYVNGYYTGSGGVVTNNDGSMVISGMPIIPVDWCTDDKILIVDRDYLERVEAESIAIEFFEQDSDNVQKNLITARIECLEEVNPMFPASLIYADLGNVA
jgi:hypothetical protein